MAFMDGLNDKISKLSASALEKTKEASDSIKINSAIKEEENRQKELFRQIGEKFFAVYTADSTREIDALCAAVQESMYKAETYREQLMKLKGAKTCGNCGAEVAANAAFCSRCGAPMREKEPTNFTQNICSGCGKPLEDGSKFCTWCGTPASDTPAAFPHLYDEIQGKIEQQADEFTAAPETENVDASESAQMEAETYDRPSDMEPAQIKRCSGCGAELADGQRFCTNCGMKCE